VIAFGGRVMDDSLPKSLNSPETPLYSKSNVLYCLDQAKDHGRKLKYFIIVEGYLDALACHQYGAKNAVATLGTALTEGHLRLMRRFAQNLVLIFDPDPAGVKAAMRGLDQFVSSGMKVNVVSLPGGDDPDTFLKKKGYEAFASCLKTSVKFMDFVLSQVVPAGSPVSIDEKVEKAGEMLGYIAKLPSSIERDHYLKRTAEALELDETVLRQEMPQQAKRSSSLPAKGPAAGAPRSYRPKAEEILIHLMLRDEGIARNLKAEIQPKDFSDPLFRRAAERIFGVLGAGSGLTISALLAEGDEELNTLISHYSMLELEYDNAEKSYQDCMDVIKQHDPEKRMKQIVKAIKEAEARGDSTTLAQLIEEQKELSRRPGRRILGL
jgi:DNA primase